MLPTTPLLLIILCSPRVCRDLPVVCTYPNGVTALQTSFLNWLSQNFTHVFPNIISCLSSRFDLLWSKTRSKSNSTDFLASPLYRLFLIRLSWNFTHVFTNIVSCMSSCFDLMRSKNRSKSNLTDFLYHSTDITYPIVTNLHTCSQTSSLVGVRVSIFSGQKLGQHRIWQIFNFLSDCHETSHTCPQTSSLVRVCVLTFCGQKLGHQIWQIFICYSIVTKLQTDVHGHHLLCEFAFQPSAVKN